MNATSAPSAPGRGSSSTSRTPLALSCASAAVDVVDAQRDVMDARARASRCSVAIAESGAVASSSSSAVSPDAG